MSMSFSETKIARSQLSKTQASSFLQAFQCKNIVFRIAVTCYLEVNHGQHSDDTACESQLRPRGFTLNAAVKMCEAKTFRWIVNVIV